MNMQAKSGESRLIVLVLLFLALWTLRGNLFDIASQTAVTMANLDSEDAKR